MDDQLKKSSEDYKMPNNFQNANYEDILAELANYKRQNTEIKLRNRYLEQIIEINHISTLDTLVDYYFLTSKDFYKKLASTLLLCEYEEKKREKIITLINYYQNLIEELKKFL